MLSENLKALHAHLADYTTTGAEISAEGMMGICAVLEQAAEDAQKLEQAAVPMPQRRTAMPEGALLLIKGGKQ